MLHAKNLALSLWAEAVQTAVYLLIHSESQIHGYKTTYELWTGRHLAIGHLWVFESVAFAHVPKANRRKLGAKSMKTH
jgi:hypothetical protein